MPRRHVRRSDRKQYIVGSKSFYLRRDCNSVNLVTLLGDGGHMDGKPVRLYVQSLGFDEFADRSDSQ